MTDPFGQEVRDFLTKIAMEQRAVADGTGDGEIEASQRILDYYNPNGLGPAGYFIFQSITVYPEGKTEEIKARGREQMGKRLHGSTEGEVVGT